jgi:hypothetical protein
MQVWPSCVVLSAAALFITSFVFAQTPEKSASLEIGAAIAGSLIWGEDDMGVPVTIVLNNRTGQDATNIVTTPALFLGPDASAKAHEILQKDCPAKIRADMEASGPSVPRNGAKQIRFVSHTDVEELDPNADAAPALLVCANYKLAGESHKSAVLYRVLHMDPVKGARPVDRVSGDVPAQSLKLEELGRYAE